MRLFVDLDNVTYPFHDVMHGYAEYRLGRKLPDPPVWAMYREWGLTGDDFSKMMRDGCDDEVVFWQGAPIPGALEALDELWQNHEVVICTHRGEYAREATEYWLGKWAIPYHELLLVTDGDKTVFSFDVLLDDAPHNIEAALIANQRAVFYTQPWNVSVNHPRVNTWQQFVEYVDILEDIAR